MRRGNVISLFQAMMAVNQFMQPASVDTHILLRYIYMLVLQIEGHIQLCLVLHYHFYNDDKGFQTNQRPSGIRECTLISIFHFSYMQYIVSELNNSVMFETVPDGATTLHFAACKYYTFLDISKGNIWPTPSYWPGEDVKVAY